MSHPPLRFTFSPGMFAALLLLTNIVMAADATFTPDNKLVVQIEPQDSKTLLEIDPDTGGCRKLFEPMKEELVAITLDRHDRWLLATKQSIWGWKRGDAAPAKITDVPATEEGWKVSVEDLAADPKSDRLLVTCNEEREGKNDQTPAWIYDTTANKWGKVRCRYVPGIETPCFNARGELCFSVHGDIWHGLIEEDKPWALVAYRYAAVATLYTYNGTPSQEGTRRLAAAGGQLVIKQARMGGSGWGTVLAIPGPDQDLSKSWGAPGLKEQLTTAGKIAGHINEFNDGSGTLLMGNSRDGSRVWIMWPSSKRGLVFDETDGPSVKLKLP